MTEKNADVEWLRYALSMAMPEDGQRVTLSRPQAQRLLAHIDQLEADLREARNEWESARERAESAKSLLDEAAMARNGLVAIVACKEEKIAELEAELRRRATLIQIRNPYEDPDRRPSIHEIAAQMMATMRLASYLSHKQVPTDSETIASWSYADAEALVAEGGRRG